MPAALPVLTSLRGDLRTLPTRFAAKVNAADGDGCWEWTGTRNPNSYGQIDKVAAHRVSYFLATGNDPGEMLVLHRCDNPPCVRPTHLFLGTHLDNMVDMAAKGRSSGRWKRIQKVTPELRERARLMYAEGYLQREIAVELGVGQPWVSRLVRGTASLWRLAGLRVGNQKLLDQEVRAIRDAYSSGAVTYQQLADRFGVSPSHVSDLVNRRERTDVA